MANLDTGPAFGDCIARGRIAPVPGAQRYVWRAYIPTPGKLRLAPKLDDQVLPEIVTTRDNGYKAVKYDKLTAVLLQAVKDLREEIRECKATK